MNQIQKGGARYETGLDSKKPGNRENHPGPCQNGCPGMMKQGSDREMGSQGDTCPCMKNSDMGPGNDNQISGHQERENQDQQSGNYRKSGGKIFHQGPGQERMNEGTPGERSFSGEKHCQGFDGKDTSSSHHRFQRNADESRGSGQTNQEQVYLIEVK